MHRKLLYIRNQIKIIVLKNHALLNVHNWTIPFMITGEQI
jgi:hypothetical protein